MLTLKCSRSLGTKQSRCGTYQPTFNGHVPYARHYLLDFCPQSSQIFTTFPWSNPSSPNKSIHSLVTQYSLIAVWHQYHSALCANELFASLLWPLAPSCDLGLSSLHTFIFENIHDDDLHRIVLTAPHNKEMWSKVMTLTLFQESSPESFVLISLHWHFGFQNLILIMSLIVRK